MPENTLPHRIDHPPGSPGVPTNADLPDAVVPDDADEDARLTALAEQITPSPERLRAIRAKLPPSTISYDDEPGQPF